MNKHKIDIKKNHLSWEKTYVKKCDKQDCEKKGEFRAPKSRVMLNKDFQVLRNLSLTPSATSNGFNYRFKGVEGRISYVGEQIRKAHFQIVCGLNAE